MVSETFRNWLMRDGFHAYRSFDQRPRCLAHQIRKAQGLEDGYDRQAQRFGCQLLDPITTVIHAVSAARGGAPPQGLRQSHAPTLNALVDACLQQTTSPHPPTRALAHDLLNDWHTIWVVLDHSALPLTNNEAEGALRHWVVSRRIAMGAPTK